jgi:hypothetical protein
MRSTRSPLVETVNVERRARLVGIPARSTVVGPSTSSRCRATLSYSQYRELMRIVSRKMRAKRHTT